MSSQISSPAPQPGLGSSTLVQPLESASATSCLQLSSMIVGIAVEAHPGTLVPTRSLLRMWATTSSGT